MTLLRLHVLVSYLFAGLGLIGLSLGTEVSTGAMLLLAVGYVGSLFAGPKQWASPRFSRFVDVALVATLLLQVLRGLLGASVLPLVLEFAGVLQITRLIYRPSAREYYHILALSILHLIAATVLTSGLDYAAVFFGFVLVTPWMLAMTHLRAEIERHYGPSSPRTMQRMLQSKSVAGGKFLGGMAALTLPLFVLSAAFFMLVPRVGVGFLDFGRESGQQVAGFGGNVELGGFGTIRDNPEVVMRIVPAQNRGQNQTFRLRGTSFDLYDGRGWQRSNSEPEPVRASLGTFILRAPPRFTERRMQITLEPISEPVLFLPEGTIGVEIPPRISEAQPIERRLSRREGLDIRFDDADGMAFQYSALIAPEAELSERLSAEQRELYLQLPNGLSERVIEQARELTRESVSDAERVRRILDWLRNSGTFEYSLTMPDVGERDPLDVFLFEAKSGHCEYFSSAFSVLARAAGVPTRNVTGFLGGTYNRYGRYYTITQGDAHSWAEAWVDGRWQTVDPTPPGRGELGPSNNLLSDFRAFIDAVRARWQRDVVGFDLRHQTEGLRSLYRWFRQARGTGTESPDQSENSSPSAWLRSSNPFGFAGILALIASFLVGGWLFSRRSRKRYRSEALFRELERTLSKLGKEVPAGSPPMQQIRVLEKEDHPIANVSRKIATLYLGERFGDLTVRPTEIRELRRELRRTRN